MHIDEVKNRLHEVTTLLSTITSDAEKWHAKYHRAKDDIVRLGKELEIERNKQLREEDNRAVEIAGKLDLAHRARDVAKAHLSSLSLTAEDRKRREEIKERLKYFRENLQKTGGRQDSMVEIDKLTRELNEINDVEAKRDYNERKLKLELEMTSLTRSIHRYNVYRQMLGDFAKHVSFPFIELYQEAKEFGELDEFNKVIHDECERRLRT